MFFMKKHRQKVFFDHIPKSCGSSLTELFRKAYGEHRVAPTSMGEQALVAKKLFRKYDVVIGHFGGVIFDNWPSDFFSCTLIRDPVERALSTYYYFQNMPHLGIPQVEALRGMSLEEFADSQIPLVNEILNNPLSRHFAAAAGYTEDYANTRLTWEAAIKGFESYSYIGVCEEFEHSVKGLFKALSLNAPKVDYKNYKLNKNDNREDKEKLPPEIIQAIECRNSYDIELYKAAKANLTNKRKYKFTPNSVTNHAKSPLSSTEVKVQGIESGAGKSKTGENLKITVSFNLLESAKYFGCAIKICNIFDEVVFGMNNDEGTSGVDLPCGSHSIEFDLEVLLKHGRYSVSASISVRDDSVFGDLPRWATPKPQAFFDVLGNIGTPFFGAYKIPLSVHSESVRKPV